MVFDALNFERSGIVLNQFYDDLQNNQIFDANDIELEHKIPMLAPIQAARREKIYRPTKYSENLFHIFKNSVISEQLREKYLDLFSIKLKTRILSEVDGENNSEIEFADKNNIDINDSDKASVSSKLSLPEITPVEFGNHENFLVQFHAVELKSWTDNIFRRFGLFRTPSKCYVVNKAHLLITPEVIINENATNEDIFRILVIVYRVTWLLESRHSHSKQSWHYINQNKLDKTSQHPSTSSSQNNKSNANLSLKILNNSESELQEVFMDQNTLNNKYLPSLVAESYDFEKNWSDVIHKKLAAAGWCSKFTFGTIRSRETLF